MVRGRIGLFLNCNLCLLFLNYQLFFSGDELKRLRDDKVFAFLSISVTIKL